MNTCIRNEPILHIWVLMNERVYGAAPESTGQICTELKKLHEKMSVNATALTASIPAHSFESQQQMSVIDRSPVLDRGSSFFTCCLLSTLV